MSSLSAPRQNSRHQCLGFTLVEFMIALFIGTFLAAVSTSLYGNFRSASLLHREIVDANNEIRIATQVVREEILKAGYRSDFYRGMDQVFPRTAPLGKFKNYAFDSSDVIEGNNSFALIRYQGDSISEHYRIRNCAGQPVDPGNVLVVALEYDRSARSLVCRDSASSAVTTIVSNLRSLSFQFGVDSNGDGYADAYINDTRSNSAPVVSVKLQVEVNRLKSKLPGVDADLVRVGSQVIMVRNGK